MVVKKVKPGDTLQVPVIYGQATIGHETWTVSKVYPYHVMAVRGLYRQCFTAGELVQMGLENGHNRQETHKGGSSGKAWRWSNK